MSYADIFLTILTIWSVIGAIIFFARIENWNMVGKSKTKKFILYLLFGPFICLLGVALFLLQFVMSACIKKFLVDWDEK